MKLKSYLLVFGISVKIKDKIPNQNIQIHIGVLNITVLFYKKENIMFNLVENVSIYSNYVKLRTINISNCNK